MYAHQLAMQEVLYPQPPSRRTARHAGFDGRALADALDGSIRAAWAMLHALRHGREQASELPWRFTDDRYTSSAADYLRQWKSERQMYAQRAKQERVRLLDLLELRRAALRPRRAAKARRAA